MNSDKSLHTPAGADEMHAVGLEEACRICRIEIEFVHSLVMEGVFENIKREPETWYFDREGLAKLRKAARLHHDLKVNAPGIALILELLARLEN